ncbi:MAG: c-type cytochrome [Vicinamibacterales bacterium]
MSIMRRRGGTGFVGAVAISATVGLGAVVVGLGWRPTPSTGAAVAEAPAPSEEYGRRLVTRTAELLGEDQADPSRRYIKSRLNCASCHLSAGTEPGALTLLQTEEHYPRFSARAGDMTEIEDRINECMQRSMNGAPLPMDSLEMKAMASYLRSLGAEYLAMGASSRTAKDPSPFKPPTRAADLEHGRSVFGARCATCHGVDGLGLLATGEKRQGYLFPPLWGPDSYNTGAGMHRVLTAARFVKARMPLGNPTLTDDEALDVAAFFNAQPRPEMPNLERDYPDKRTKPVDNPYGPYADEFPVAQHKFGPFKPIEEYYAALRKQP